MSKAFDYSKWDRIDLSDDEEQFQEGFDRNLNIMMRQSDRDAKEYRLEEDRQNALDAGDVKLAAKLEARMPLHDGNMCSVKEDRTIIVPERPHVPEDEEFSTEAFREFKVQHAALLEEFVEADWGESLKLLQKDADVLLTKDAENFLLLAALDAEVAGERLRLERLGCQTQIVSQIRHLSRTTERPAKAHVSRYFEKFEAGEAQEAFQDQVVQFVQHIKQKALERRRGHADVPEKPGNFDSFRKEKVVDAMYSLPVDTRRGPGGLDPVEVFQSLPERMQEAFKTSNMALLEEAGSDMEEAEFDAHLKRCVDSGLWKAG